MTTTIHQLVETYRVSLQTIPAVGQSQGPTVPPSG
jgi:hypothetical protein